MSGRVHSLSLPKPVRLRLTAPRGRVPCHNLHGEDADPISVSLRSHCRSAERSHLLLSRGERLEVDIVNIKHNLICLIATTRCDVPKEFVACNSRKFGVCRAEDNLPYCSIQAMANHFIANGVTIPMWISVSDRLPPLQDDVLMLFDGNMAVGFCNEDDWCQYWYARTGNGEYVNCDLAPSHWMPLPKRPKMEGGTGNSKESDNS